MTSSDLFITAAAVLITTSLPPASLNDSLLNWCEERSYISNPEYVKLAATITARKQFDDTTCYIFIEDASRDISIQGTYTSEQFPGEEQGFSADIEKAREICRSYEATLPTLRDEVERGFLCNFIISQTRMNADSYTLLGLNETRFTRFSETWIWDDKTPVEPWDWLLDPSDRCFREVELRQGDRYYFELAVHRPLQQCYIQRCASFLTVKHVQYALYCKKRFTPSTATSTTTTSATMTKPTGTTFSATIPHPTANTSPTSSSTGTSASASSISKPKGPGGREPRGQEGKGSKIALSYVAAVAAVVSTTYAFKKM